MWEVLDTHFKILHYEADASRVFPNTYINGGVVISYHSNAERFGGIEIFTAFDVLNNIVHKIVPTITEKSLGTIIYNQNKFNLDLV